MTTMTQTIKKGCIMLYDAFIKRIFHDAEHKFESGYGYRTHPILKTRKWHDGWDFSTAKKKINIYSPVSGVVTESKYSSARGYYLTIRTKAGLWRGQHFNSKYVVVGQRVHAGQLIALSGMTGMSTGIHLHMECKTLAGLSMDPTTFIANYNDAVYPGPMPNALVTVGKGTSANIQKWQKFLAWYFETYVKIDGDFQKITAGLTSAFQKDMGLKQDILVGPATRQEAKTVLK